MPFGMNRDPLEGMTDYGLSEPSQANSVGSDSPDLDQLLAGMPEDVKKLTGPAISEAAKASTLRSELEGLENTPIPSKKDILLTPGSIAKLLAGGAAAAFGGPEGLALALGITTGTLKKAEQVQTLKAEAKNTEITAKQKQLDESQKLIENSQQKISSLLQAQPELFVGPDGQTLAPEALGYLATGVSIPLYPGAQANENKRKVRWDKQWGFLQESLKSVKSKEDAKPVVHAMFTMLDWENPPAGVEDALVNSIGTPEFDTQFAATLLRFGGPSALSALRYAAENGLAYTDIEVLRKVSFQDTDATQPSQVINAKQLELMDEVNNWIKENPDQYQKILEAGENSADISRQTAEAALAGRQADIDFYLDKNNVPREMDLANFMKVYGVVDRESGLLNVMGGAGAAKAMKGATPEQIKNYKANTAVQMLDEMTQEAKNNNGRRMATLRGKKRIDIKTKVPAASEATINMLLNMAIERASKRVKKADDGSVNVEELEREVDAVMPEIIETYNEVR